MQGSRRARSDTQRRCGTDIARSCGCLLTQTQAKTERHTHGQNETRTSETETDQDRKRPLQIQTQHERKRETKIEAERAGVYSPACGLSGPATGTPTRGFRRTPARDPYQYRRQSPKHGIAAPAHRVAKRKTERERAKERDTQVEAKEAATAREAGAQGE
eukprot:218469-Rhodomonas_salina.1